MTESERKARLKAVDKQTAETLSSVFYRQHPTLRKQTLDYLKQRRDALMKKKNPSNYGLGPLPKAGMDVIYKGRIARVKGWVVPKSGAVRVRLYFSDDHSLKDVLPEHVEKLTAKRNGLFDGDAVKRARQVTRTPKRVEKPKARRTVVEKETGEKGYLLATLPGGWLKVKWDNRERPTLIKRSELKRANPGLLDLVGGMQALDYLSSKYKGAKKRNPSRGGSGAGASSSDVRSPTRTSTEVRSPTKTSTVADTRGNITVTGGAGAGATTKVIVKQMAARKRNPTGDHSYKPKLVKIAGTIRSRCATCGEIKGLHRKTNPSPAEMSERFQGHATGAVKNYYASDSAPRLDYSRAGRLVFLKVNGKQIRIPYAVAAIDPKTEKIWIAGSKRGAMFTRKAARKGEALDFGEVEAICYLTAKSHIGSGRRYEYVHAFGEEGGRKPHLLVDHEGMPILRGGDYRIKAEGIVD